MRAHFGLAAIGPLADCQVPGRERRKVALRSANMHRQPSTQFKSFGARMQRSWHAESCRSPSYLSAINTLFAVRDIPPRMPTCQHWALDNDRLGRIEDRDRRLDLRVKVCFDTLRIDLHDESKASQLFSLLKDLL